MSNIIAALAATLLVAATSAFAAPVQHANGAHATKAHPAQQRHADRHAARHTPRAVQHRRQAQHPASAHTRQHAG